jgi:hypothetical protein
VRRRASFPILVLALLVGTVGCGADTPTRPGLHRVSGSVVLTGYLTNESGQVLGTRAVSDADSVLVELVGGAGVIATAYTTRGQYSLQGVPDGAYRVRVRVTGAIQATSAVVTVAGRDVAHVDPLWLVSQGDLKATPNPFRDWMICWYALPDSEDISVRVFGLQGTLERVLYEGPVQAGSHLEFWDGTNDRGDLLRPGDYWFTLRDAHATRAHLVFIE